MSEREVEVVEDETDTVEGKRAKDEKDPASMIHALRALYP